jgi:hypothetical protein
MKKNIPILFFGLFAIIAIFSIFSLVDFADYFGPMAIQTPMPSAPKTILIGVPFGDRLGQHVTGISDTVISGLARGLVKTGQGRTYYTQSIQFDVPGFLGFSSDFRTDYKEIGTDPKETLFCLGGSNDVWMQYRLDFESGLYSRVKDERNLIDFDDEQILILGGIYTFVDSIISGTAAQNGVLELRLMGAGGVLVLQDNPYDNDFTSFGVRVNGVPVNVDLRITGNYVRADKFVITGITMRFRCEGLGGELLIPKMTCASQRLGYTIFNPDFDLCFLGRGTEAMMITGSVVNKISGSAVVSNPDFKIHRVGSTKLYISGEGYSKVPFFYVQGGQLLPGKGPGQAMWWVEQGPGANWISRGDYFLLNSRRNDDRAKLKVYEFKGADTSNNNIQITDLSGRKHHIPFDPVTGNCINTIPNLGNGAMCHYDAVTGRLAVDQDGDGTYNGQANWIISNSFNIVNLGPQFPGAATTLTYTVLSRRLSEGGPNVVVQTTINADDPVRQAIVDSPTCPLTGDYNYGCMSLRAGTLFNLGNREYGGDIYVGGGGVPSQPSSKVVVTGSKIPSSGQASYTSPVPSSALSGGRIGIVLTFEAGRLRGY